MMCDCDCDAILVDPVCVRRPHDLAHTFAAHHPRRSHHSCLPAYLPSSRRLQH
ncbi:hypothetical protein BO82DRAFT_353336 [Aspergillus uvarum CBS 121591]|uniref:Uncharacterized protein n=1 Tax=Aspergillus uvarum CBS 121591 TaxID=1448315 RepID=A0A319CGU6_9EURO|nr:hypothetical protein BO82DRAFT_353336 [Aspergillus uvarum CBS 121591]PYH83031.1 hypothetical protein BO82DRAFT_353336 [Aspergillus uvarum CBS 121591]